MNPILAEINPKVIGAAVIGVVVLCVAVVSLKKSGAFKKSARRSAGKSDNSNTVELYVGNLSYDMTEEQLRKEFSKWGVVSYVKIISHSHTGKSKGYGFVEMPHRKEAEIAIDKLNNAEVMGRRLRVNEARPNTKPKNR